MENQFQGTITFGKILKIIIPLYGIHYIELRCIDITMYIEF